MCVELVAGRLVDEKDHLPQTDSENPNIRTITLEINKTVNKNIPNKWGDPQKKEFGS